MALNEVGTESFEEYQIKIKTIVAQLISGEKHLAIWGAGENGNRFMRYCSAIHIPVQCFVDINSKLWGTERWEIPVISPEELFQLDNIVVLISFPSTKAVQSVVEQIERIPFTGRAFTYFDDNLYYLLQNVACERKETAREIIVSMYKTVKDVEYLHMPILSPGLVTTRCNLKCKDCILRVPYLKEQKDADLPLLFAELDRTLEIVDSIKTLEVCGGETFLLKELISFLSEVKKYTRIFNICVVTNGTMLPDDKVFDAMRDSNIVLKISDYGTISKKIPELEEKCREKDIPCFVQDCRWFDLAPSVELNYSLNELQKLFDECNIKDCCIRNWGGVIYRCGFQEVWTSTGLLSDFSTIKKDGVNLNDRSNDELLKEKLRKYLSATVPFEICRYCRGNTKPIPRAIQL